MAFGKCNGARRLWLGAGGFTSPRGFCRREHHCSLLDILKWYLGWRRRSSCRHWRLVFVNGIDRRRILAHRGLRAGTRLSSISIFLRTFVQVQRRWLVRRPFRCCGLLRIRGWIWRLHRSVRHLPRLLGWLQRCCVANRSSVVAESALRMLRAGLKNRDLLLRQGWNLHIFGSQRSCAGSNCGLRAARRGRRLDLASVSPNHLNRTLLCHVLRPPLLQFNLPLLRIVSRR